VRRRMGAGPAPLSHAPAPAPGGRLYCPAVPTGAGGPMRAALLALLIALAPALAGCGQKGELYLPDERPAPEGGR